jgi:hypothetical protein
MFMMDRFHRLRPIAGSARCWVSESKSTGPRWTQRSRSSWSGLKDKPFQCLIGNAPEGAVFSSHDLARAEPNRFAKLTSARFQINIGLNIFCALIMPLPGYAENLESKLFYTRTAADRRAENLMAKRIANIVRENRERASIYSAYSAES